MPVNRMPSLVRFGPDDLLEYNTTHGVIICRQCQYAIQKSALQSHLLRHKIFRQDRQQLLDILDRLTIFEPEEVPLPSLTSKPIEALPIVSGFRCTIGPCGSLYASSKRMKRHQVESHVDFQETESFESTTRPATLQTFFLGTKIKYFEVEASTDARETQNPTDNLEALIAEKTYTNTSSRQPVDVCMHADVTEPALLSQTTNPACSSNIDLQTLTYFHYFTSVTSLTLPSLDPIQSSTLYWQVEFVSQALQQKWLMTGLLAIAASHMGALAQHSSIAATHYGQSDRLYLEFTEGRNTNAHALNDTSYSSSSTPCVEALDQIDSFLRCARIMRLYDPLSTLDELIMAMRGLSNSRDRQRPGELYKKGAFDRAARLTKTKASDPTLAAILTQLDTLPTRMAEALGRPDDIRSVFTALSAIATLIDSCVAGFEIDDVALWATVAWLSQVGEKFHEMLSRNEPAALVVLAHWAALLLRRVEEKGHWFLRGAAKSIVANVAERLPHDQSAVRQLIADL